MSLGERIRDVRERQLGLTQLEFSQQLKTRRGGSPDPVNISRWERDIAEPSLWYIRQIAQLADRPVSYFLDDKVAA